MPYNWSISFQLKEQACQVSLDAHLRLCSSLGLGKVGLQLRHPRLCSFPCSFLVLQWRNMKHAGAIRVANTTVGLPTAAVEELVNHSRSCTQAVGRVLVLLETMSVPQPCLQRSPCRTA